MEVVVASHPSAELHDPGPRHPERSQRVQAVLRGALSSGLTVTDIVAPSAEPATLELVHDAAYIEMIREFCSLGGGALDMDTVVSPASWEAALTAVGAVLVLLETLEVRPGSTGLAVTRPPGHHAMPAAAMGFCVFNNVAVAAAQLIARGRRVAIIDWDVHHGNGTQAMLGDHPEALYISIHQSNFYPFEGFASDIDVGAAPGTVVNIPLPAGTWGDAYRLVWDQLVMPVTEQFAPDWILVSAGFDAHRLDPLAGFNLEAGDYGYLAARLAQTHPPDRTVFALEGGYDLTALEESTRATLLGIAGLTELADPIEETVVPMPPSYYEVLEAVSRHWDI